MKWLALALALLGGTAEADGCMGLPSLHCGPSLSLIELGPLQRVPVQLAPGGGIEFDYHFQKWSLGSAIYLNGVVPLGKAPTPSTEISAAIFPCLGQSFGVLNGVCIGPKLALPFERPAAFTWKDDFRFVVHLNPDMLANLMSAVAKLQ